MTPAESKEAKKQRRRSRTVGPEARSFLKMDHLDPGVPVPRSWSAVDVRDPPVEQVRGRQAKSDVESVKGKGVRVDVLSAQTFVDRVSAVEAEAARVESSPSSL